MKKVVIVFLLTLMMIGCSNQAFNREKYAAMIKTIADESVQENKNNYKKYYSFYSDPALGIKNSGDLYNVFSYDKYEIIMNVNLKHIINTNFYQDEDNFVDENQAQQEPLFRYDGEYLNSDNKQKKFRVMIYNKDGKYLVDLFAEDVSFSSICNDQDIDNITKKMFYCLKNVNVNRELLLDDYSLKLTFTSKKKEIDLFKVSVPSSGHLEDIIKPNSN